jgi:uncharacterized membrane protein YcaP (DUF421 family)
VHSSPPVIMSSASSSYDNGIDDIGAYFSLMFYNGWKNIVKVVVMSILMYAVVVILLRLYGKRSLARMNLYDLVVTVAAGSAAVSVILSNTSFVQGLICIFVLLNLQLCLSFLSSFFPLVNYLGTSEPSLIVYDGHIIKQQLHLNRMTEIQIQSCLRNNGLADLNEVHAIVLEPDGNLSLVKKSTMENSKDHFAFKNITFWHKMKERYGKEKGEKSQPTEVVVTPADGGNA